MYGVEPGSGLAVLLEWLARPYDPERVTAALLGLPTAGRPGSSSVPCSPPATRPRTCSTPCPPSCGRWRSPPPTSPSGASARSAGRCCGARRCRLAPSSAGDPGLFVCATTTKAYDTDENRVLKAALAAVHRAGRHAEHGHGGLHRRGGEAGPPQRSARRSPPRAPDPRPGARRRARPAAPSAAPGPAADATPTAPPSPCCGGRASRCRRRTSAPSPTSAPRAQHDLLAATLQHLEDVTGTARCSAATTAGWSPGRSRSTTPAAAATPDHVDGITIGDVLLDVPDPLDGDLDQARGRLAGARRTRRRAVLALGAADVEDAVAARACS